MGSTDGMLARLALRLVLLALIIGLTAKVVPGIDVHGGFGTLLWLAVLLSLVNLIIGPILRLLSLPLILLTLGLFLLIVNTAVLAITAGLSSHLDIDGFWPAFLGALIISVCGWAAELLLPVRERDKARR